MSSFGELPPEIVKAIFSFLAPKTLGQIARVNRFFKKFSYELLFDIELLSNANDKVDFYFPVFKKINPSSAEDMTSWNHINSVKNSTPRLFYRDLRKLLTLYPDIPQGSYKVMFSLNEICCSKNFACITGKIYQSACNIPPEKIISYIPNQENSKEIMNPFYQKNQYTYKKT